jgi:glucose-1-phosphate thymidylyltransferase
LAKDHQPTRKWPVDVVGLIPAAGRATRIARTVNEGRSVRPKVVCHYLLEKMKFAGVNRAFIILRDGKWDIPAYLDDGTMVDMYLAYLMVHVPFGPSYTLNQAYPFVQDALVVFGFPDILFEPDDAFIKLLNRQETTGADIVLGLFPADRPQAMDMVEIDKHGKARSIVIKPTCTDLRDAWIIAVWTPVFTKFLHAYIQDHQSNRSPSMKWDLHGQQDLSVGRVFQAAVNKGLHVQTIRFSQHTFLDIGTPENLFLAVSDPRFSSMFFKTNPKTV